MLDLQPSKPLRIAVLVKQIPKFEEMELGSDGRLIRDSVELHMNDYCRRAVRAGCELARASAGTCTAITLGPPEAESVLREAILCGCEEGLHVCDPSFAGSDTLATARSLASSLELHGPWDLVLCGRNSIDSDTGQVPAQLAELLGFPLLAGVRELSIEGETLRALLEHNDERVRTSVVLPAVLSCAERLCDPCKIKEPSAWATVAPGLLTRISASDLGSGPWGLAASPTRVGEVNVFDVDRSGRRFDTCDEATISRMVELVRSRWANREDRPNDRDPVPETGGKGPTVLVFTESDRQRTAAELVGAAARLAESVGGSVTVVCAPPVEPTTLGSQGADRIFALDGDDEEAVVTTVDDVLGSDPPWGVLIPGTDWGRQVAGRLAARWDAGLTGDAVDLEVRDGRLIALKPAFGGRLVAEISCLSPTQMATVRPGVLQVSDPRATGPIPVVELPLGGGSGVQVEERWRDDDADTLINAQVVIGVGRGVDPEDYPVIDGLADRIGAVTCATRKVTDEGWMPRARQVGITGHTIAPHLYIAVGTSGKFNHMIGVRSAGTIVGINPDPKCELWDWCDVGVIAEWHDVLESLVERLSAIGVNA